MKMPELTTDESQSEEWKKIKDWANGANKQAKHPLDQEMERMQRRKPQNMDQGGVAGDASDEAASILSGGQSGLPFLAGATEKLAAPTGMPPWTPPITQKPAVSSPLPPTTQNDVPAQPSPAQAPTDAPYMDKASGVLGGITPEAIAQLMQSLNSQGKRAQIGAGIAGIGDAISSIGGQKPEHMKAAEDHIQQQKEMAMKVPEAMAAVGKERYGISQQLEARDPKSPYSKVVQNSQRPTLKGLGWTDEQINQVGGEFLNDAVKNGATFADTQERIKQEGMYQTGMLGVRNKELEENHWIQNLGNKFKGSGSNSNFDHTAIPSGTVYKAPDGTMRRKS